MPLVLSLSGTTARTRSPVLKPLTCFCRRRYPRGKPCLLPFLRLAAVTVQCQVRDATGPASATGPDMIELKRGVAFSAVDALVRIFEQEIGSYFPPKKLPMLVLDASDLGVLE